MRGMLVVLDREIMALRNIETGLRLLTKIDQAETGGLAPVLREFQKTLLLFSLLLVVEH